MDYLLHIVVLAGIYITLAVSLDLLVGQMGLLSLAHAAFYGIGAYSTALLVTIYSFPFAVGILAGMLIACAGSLAISLASLRLNDDYFVIATFGFQMILFGVLNNWMGVTRGPLGVSNIPEPVVLGWSINSPGRFAVAALFLALLAVTVVTRITTAPFGRVMRAIREDAVFAQSLGKNILRFKVTVAATSAMLAAAAGSLYAHYVTYIDPTSFTVMESILIVSMVIIGGSGSRWGPVTGAVALVVLPEALRVIGLPSAAAGNLRQMFYGAMLVILMMVRPRGLIGHYGLGR